MMNLVKFKMADFRFYSKMCQNVLSYLVKAGCNSLEFSLFSLFLFILFGVCIVNPRRHMNSLKRYIRIHYESLVLLFPISYITSSLTRTGYDNNLFAMYLVKASDFQILSYMPAFVTLNE